MSAEVAEPLTLLKTEQCAAIANVAPRTWRYWASIGRVPAPVVDGSRLKLWRPEDVERWRKTGRAR